MRGRRSEVRTPVPRSLLLWTFVVMVAFGTVSSGLNLPLRSVGVEHSGASGTAIAAGLHPVGPPSGARSHPPAKIGPEVPVSGPLPGANAEVEEAVDPGTHHIYALWIAQNGIGFSRSTDGGVSFQGARIVPGSEDFSNATTFTSSWDPAIATSANGTVFAAFMVSNSTTLPGGAPVVSVSYDQGRTFAFSSIVKHTSPASASDREFIAVGPNGDVYVTWDYAPNGSEIQYLCSPTGSCGFSAGDLNAVFVRSTDGGHRWSRMVPVSPGFPISGADSAPLVVQPNGRIDVLYQGYQTNRSTLALSDGREYFTASTDRGHTWTPPVLVGNSSYTMTDGEWWIDGNLALGADGMLYATYDSQKPYGDIGWLLYSTDYGRTWSSPIRATPGSTGAAHIIQVTAGARGVAYVGWISNDSAGKWGGYLSVFSTAHHRLSAPLRVNSYYGLAAIWPGDTIGLVFLGDQRVSVGWGIGRFSGGQLSDKIFNVIVNFDHDTHSPDR